MPGSDVQEAKDAVAAAMADYDRAKAAWYALMADGSYRCHPEEYRAAKDAYFAAVKRVSACYDRLNEVQAQ